MPSLQPPSQLSTQPPIQPPLPLARPHNNHQLFSDYYLDKILPLDSAWSLLHEEAAHARQALAALYFYLYGLDHEEAADILDTFPIVRRQDEARYEGRYRTRDLILAYARRKRAA